MVCVRLQCGFVIHASCVNVYEMCIKLLFMLPCPGLGAVCMKIVFSGRIVYKGMIIKAICAGQFIQSMKVL